jgi:hypothetical protein
VTLWIPDWRLASEPIFSLFFSSPARLSINKHHNSSIIFDRRSIVSQWHNKLFYQHRWAVALSLSTIWWPGKHAFLILVLLCFAKHMWLLWFVCFDDSKSSRGVCFKSMIVALVYFMARVCWLCLIYGAGIDLIALQCFICWLIK